MSSKTWATVAPVEKLSSQVPCSSCRTSTVMIASWHSDQLYSAVSGAAFQRIVGVLGMRFPDAIRRQAVARNTLPGLKTLLHGRGAAPRQFEVIRIAGDVVGMADDAEFPVRVLLEDAGHFPQRRL